MSDEAKSDDWGDLAIVPVIHWDGVHDTYIDLNICRADTLEYPWGRVDHVLAELRTAYLQDCAQRGFTPWDSL